MRGPVGRSGQGTACAGGTTGHPATYTGAPSQFRRMASATLTRPRPGQPEVPAPRRRSVPWPWLALAGLIIGTTVGFFVRPTFPNYDSYYSLLWGREVLHGTLPSFDAYRAPTEHPLAIAFGALLSLVGDDADRLMVGATFASFVILAAGMYRLGRESFTWIVGLVAAALRVHALRLPVPRGAGVHRHPVPRADRLGGRARGRPAAARHARVRAPRRRRAAAPGGLAAERPVLPLVLPAGDVAAAVQVRRAGRDRPGRLARGRLDRHRRPAVLAHPHDRPGRGAGAHPRPVGDPGRDGPVPPEPRQGAGLLRGHPRARPRDRARPAARLVAARDVRDRDGDVRARRASPGCRSSTATCSSRR